MGEEQPEVDVVGRERKGGREEVDVPEGGGEEADGLEFFEGRDAEEAKEAGGEADGEEGGGRELCGRTGRKGGRKGGRRRMNNEFLFCFVSYQVMIGSVPPFFSSSFLPAML
jgi:hypothetical protein